MTSWFFPNHGAILNAGFFASAETTNRNHRSHFLGGSSPLCQDVPRFPHSAGCFSVDHGHQCGIHDAHQAGHGLPMGSFRIQDQVYGMMVTWWWYFMGIYGIYDIYIYIILYINILTYINILLFIIIIVTVIIIVIIIVIVIIIIIVILIILLLFLLLIYILYIHNNIIF